MSGASPRTSATAPPVTSDPFDVLVVGGGINGTGAGGCGTCRACEPLCPVGIPVARIQARLAGPEADPDAGPPASPEAVVAAVGDVIEAQGLRGVRFSMDAGEALPPVPIDFGLIHFLLLTQISGAADAARPRGSVRLSATGTGTGDGEAGDVRFVVEDDGPADAELEAWREGALRGRVLACALASHILEASGGSLEAGRVGAATRIELRLPAEAGARRAG